MAAVLAAAWVHGAAAGWGTWGDVSSDTGRDLELARLLASGRRLYVDVAYYYGPLPPYVNALLVRVFGAHLSVFVAAGLVVTALATAGLAAIVAPLAGPVAATAAGGAFLYCCAFAHLHYANVFNWALPYLSAATYGMLLAIWSVERCLRYARTGRRRDLTAGALLLAGAALSKAEPALAAGAAHLVLLAARGARPPLRPADTARYAAALLLVVAGYGVALGSDPVGLVRSNFTDVLTDPSMRLFLRRHAGLADTAAAFGTLAESALRLGVALGISLGAGAVADRWRANPIAAGILGASIVAPVYLTADPAVPFALLPLVGAAHVLAIIRTPGARMARLPELVLWAAALACLARMPLAASGLHYGFYLLPLPLAAFVVWWFRAVPGWLRLGSAGDRAHGWIGVVLLAAIAGRHFHDSARLFAAHDVRIDAPRGGMWLLGAIGGFPLGRAYADTVRHLGTYPASTRAMVVPTGAAIPFLAGLASAGDRTGFVPAEMGPAAEERLLARLAVEPPDVIVSLRLDLREWGSRGFGVDYARRTWAWMLARYEPVATFGPEDLVLVLRRRT